LQALGETILLFIFAAEKLMIDLKKHELLPRYYNQRYNAKLQSIIVI